MSTNFYAHWEPRDGIIFRMHIGKRSGGSFGFSGEVFPTFGAWTTFLQHNEEDVIIKDEYGVEYTFEQFGDMLNELPMSERGRQYDWVVENEPMLIDDEGRGRFKYWKDDFGYSFYNGEFF